MKLSIPTPGGLGFEAAKVVAIVAAIVFAGWFFLVRPEAAQRQAATEHTNAVVADTQTHAAQDTLHIVLDQKNADEVITHRIEVTNHDIQSSPGADQSIDPGTYDALIRSLCLQDGRSEPQCADVLHPAG